MPVDEMLVFNPMHRQDTPALTPGMGLTGPWPVSGPEMPEVVPPLSPLQGPPLAWNRIGLGPHKPMTPRE